MTWTAQTILGVLFHRAIYSCDPICRRLYTRIRRRWSRLASCAKSPHAHHSTGQSRLRAGQLCALCFARQRSTRCRTLRPRLPEAIQHRHFGESRHGCGGATCSTPSNAWRRSIFVHRTLICARSLGDSHRITGTGTQLVLTTGTMCCRNLCRRRTAAQSELRQQSLDHGNAPADRR